MARKKSRKRVSKSIFGILSIIILMLISVASFFLYFAIKNGATDLLVLFGVTNVYVQSAVAITIILVIIIVLSVLMHRKVDVGKTIKDILKT